EFVFSLLRMVEDEDLGGGLNGVGGNCVTETHWIRAAAVGADGTAVSLRWR
ncbi:hypothetical protein A2U01_0050836, partial [Trifolium medium]|nr:hypothetical protein [Trifolium medium]